MAEIEFGTYVAQEKENPYLGDIKTLADMNSEDAAIIISVDAADEQKTINFVQRAANSFDKTARVRNKNYDSATVKSYDDEGNKVYEGPIKITFTLTGKHKARRRGKSETVATETKAAKADNK